jgi:4-hydroxybenzoate polyprenyltransferase
MTLPARTSDEDMNTSVSDAPPGNWTDRYAPESWRPYLRLARLDRPIGIWLLLFPCWWGEALGEVSLGSPYPNPWYLALFAVGALVMRAAGCAFNDYVDRDIDGQVERTSSRPIPLGQISPNEALAFTVVMSLAGLAVLIQFNTFTVVLGTASLLLVAIYPFMKRVTYWPQLTLGLAFNWGALVGWAAVKGSLDLPPLLLYAGGVLWTLGYDTIYAHQDREDDELLGIKSTAIRFGEQTTTFVSVCYGGAILLWLLAGFLAGTHLIFYTAVVLVSLQMAWQVSTLDIHDAQNCLRRFRSNRDIGAVMFLGLVCDMAMSWLAGLT